MKRTNPAKGRIFIATLAKKNINIKERASPNLKLAK